MAGMGNRSAPSQRKHYLYLILCTLLLDIFAKDGIILWFMKHRDRNLKDSDIESKILLYCSGFINVNLVCTE